MIQFQVVFKKGPTTLAAIDGCKVDLERISVGDLEKVVDTEQFLERLTGVRVHIVWKEVSGEDVHRTGI